MEHTLKKGLRNIFAAEILSDDNETEGGYKTGTPFHLIPAGEMSRSTDSESTPVYYDDGVFATTGREGATEISITGAALKQTKLAELLGKYVDTETGAVIDTGEYTEKYFALGGETENIDGTSELFWFAKGTFAFPELADKTKDDTTDTNGMTLTYSAVRTNHKFTVNGQQKGVKRIVIETENTKLKADQSWTAQVVTPENLATIVEKVTA